MTFEAWVVFALFWAVFVTTPGPNAVNCISVGMQFGFRRGLWAVAAILTQASLFLILSALGVTALIAASPTVFFYVKLVGAAFLIWLGIRGWLTARRPIEPRDVTGGHLFRNAFLIATINAKSVAGYLAAFSQFVQPDVPIWSQMGVIFPTALTLTCLSYCGFLALGSGLGRLAMGAVLNVWFRRAMGVCFVIYGALLAGASVPNPGAPR